MEKNAIWEKKIYICVKKKKKDIKRYLNKAFFPTASSVLTSF